MSMEHPNPEYLKELKEGHFKPQREDNPEKIKRADEALQKSRTLERTKKVLDFIIKKLKRDTGENLENVEVIEEDKNK